MAADGTLFVQVPVDDGAIQSAFEMLDAQMDAWVQAMRRAERALAANAIGRSTQPTVSSEPSSEEAPDDAAGTIALEQNAVVSRIIEPAEAPAVVPDVTVAVAEDASIPAADPAEVPAIATAAQADVTRETAAREVVAAVQQMAPVESAGPTAANTKVNKNAEDEALLATLDEETVKAIRVMRRMCMNQKSVKELLAEYQAKKAGNAAAAATAKKSWFRRGK